MSIILFNKYYNMVSFKKALLFIILFGIEALGSYNLDKNTYIFICRNCTIDATISSSPNTGYIWYIFSSDEEKIIINDYDGEYVISGNNTGHQLFHIYCSEIASVGEIINLTLILKKPWDEDPTIINFVTVEVT